MSYQNTYIPNIVNKTGKDIYLIVLFDKNDKEHSLGISYNSLHKDKALYLHVGNNRKYFGYTIMQVFATEKKACIEKIKAYVQNNKQSAPSDITKQNLDELMQECMFFARFSAGEILQYSSAVKSDSQASCLMLQYDGTLIPVPESDLPWYNPTAKGREFSGSALCEDPKMRTRYP